MKKLLLLLVLLFVGVLVFNECGKNVPSEKYCAKDTDCGCGVHITTGDCFYGNKKYVDESRQCPDFCSGIAGHLIIKCKNNECVQEFVDIPSPGVKCTSNADCVHLPSPCHQGAAECVSKEYASTVELPDEPVACTMECRPCTKCYCEDNVCKTRISDTDRCC